MTENQDEIEKLKIIRDRQQSEASLHWTRNNIFLICSSILLLALSQFRQKPLQISICVLGLIINLAWLLIQYRSSKYIQYYKAEAEKIQLGIYPNDLKGFQLRHVAFVFPVAFMAIWATILIITSL